MTSDANYSCFLGAEGWEHAHWIGRFYPDDLPPDWRLTYYSNFFNCTYLNYSAWADVSLDELRRWLVEPAENFRLVLAAPPGGFTPEDHKRLEILRPRLGIVCNDGGAAIITPYSGPGACVRLAGSPDLKSLAVKLQTEASYAQPLYLIHSDANIGELEKLQTLLGLLGLA